MVVGKGYVKNGVISYYNGQDGEVYVRAIGERKPKQEQVQSLDVPSFMRQYSQRRRRRNVVAVI